MRLFDDEEQQIETIGTVWWYLISGGLLFLGIGLMFGAADMSSKEVGFGLAAASGYAMKYGKTLGILIARIQIPLMRSLSQSAKNAALERANKKAAAQEAERLTQEKLTKAREFIDRRLAMIDGTLRVYDGEADPSNRTILLQTAQDQIIELSAKKASGEIPAHVLTEDKLLAHARATSDHLLRLGLAEDRLNQEMLRLFNNFEAVAVPPTDAELKAKQREEMATKLKSQAEALQPHLRRVQETVTGGVRNIASTIGDTGAQGVITRLAAVDTCLSRYKIEADPTKRMDWLDKAHDEITALAKQKAAGKLTPAVLTNPDILAHARDTSAHLDQLGLGSDRLSSGIKRLFDTAS